MRLLLILVIVLTMTMGSVADELHKTDGHLDTTEAPAPFIDRSPGQGSIGSLERRIQKIIATSGRCGGCPRSDGEGRSYYDKLVPANRYDRLTRRNGCTETTQKTVETPPQHIVVGKGTDIKLPSDWAPPIAMVEPEECEYGDDSPCPPNVCINGDCKNNYVVIFTSKSCDYCKQMWPVIRTLRSQGYIVFHLDTDTYPVVYKKFKLAKWPTTIVMDKGKAIKRFNGLTTLSRLKPYLKTLKEQGLESTENKNE